MINGNEAEIISIINGTFEYDGQTYVASPEYIAQAEAYLDQDDVDCTDEQKSKAISQIYGSVKEGVEEGYLIPAGGGNANHKKKKSADAETEASKETEAQKETKASTETKAQTGTGEAAEGKSGTAETAVATESSAEREAREKAAADQAEKERLLKEQEAKEAAELEAHFKRTHNPMVLALEQISDDSTDTGEGTVSTEVQVIPFPEPTAETISTAAVTVSVLCLILGLLNHRARNKGHRAAPRRNRHILSILLSISFAAQIFFLSALLTLHFGYYDQNNLSDAFVKTGYYDTKYEAVQKEIDAFTGAIGIPNTVLSAANIEQWYKFEMRKTVLKNNESGYFEKTVVRNIQKPINDYLNTQDIELTDQANKGLANMMGTLVKSFKEGLSIPGLNEWYEEAKTEAGRFSLYALLSALTILGSTAVLFLIQEHKKHIFLYLGTGFFLGAAADLTAVILFRVNGEALFQKFFRVQTGELTRYMLFSSYTIWLMAAGIAAAAGAVFLLLNRSVRQAE